MKSTEVSEYQWPLFQQLIVDDPKVIHHFHISLKTTRSAS
jgi:hypothetical protein